MASKLVVALKRLLYGEKGDLKKQILEMQEQINVKGMTIARLEMICIIWAIGLFIFHLFKILGVIN